MAMAPWQAGADYLVDAWQRSVLYADVMRQRGNQYHAHLAEKRPNVLDFPAEIVLSGLELPRPVNYALTRIRPRAGAPRDPTRRPFVVVDPRAGHGPGIGGFKADSEIGAALAAGHPCYFIGFLPDPVAGQTIEDVMRAEAAFLEKVIELHPRSDGKPAVIGNCQAGWQVLMTAAMRPELFGPIIVAGAPLSYWAGRPGQNPMRYAGGLLGGSWLTALAGDLGKGRFDGANLVQNFEALDPANTLWRKQYHLYAHIDSEAPRYLGFEKYWGGHVFLNDVEMQYIVDNLFIGNRLATAELITSDGVRLDLRNIRSPIVVFCSHGDNITPPPQALGWITDLYRDQHDLLTHDQTIVYATHDSIGHLGIFVSGSVGRKEHRKFASNIDLIDLLPAGLYEAVIEAKDEDAPGAALVEGAHVMSIQPRGLEDLQSIVCPDPDSDRRFAAAAALSRINLGLYRSYVQRWARAAATAETAQWMQRLHPLRVGYECWSDRHPLAGQVAEAAQRVRAGRRPVAPDNPLLQWQEAAARLVDLSLQNWGALRDTLCEQTFNLVYGSPWLQALVDGPAAPHAPVRPHPGVSPEHRAYVAREIERLRAELAHGGLLEAAVRAISYVHRNRPEIDERRFNLALRLVEQAGPGSAAAGLDLAAFRALLRRQTSLLRLDFEGAIANLPRLLARARPDAIRRMARALQRLLTEASTPTPEERLSLDRMLALFESAARRGKRAPAAAGTRARRTRAGGAGS
ncbi:DUF3141 domain-containing protein [Bordetella petrii]|uniref:DUF3141 domain-containing protein n=1 Tax=Bordetella petrii TaxID=94624 RepID=A0ABT7W5K1_9BORD|nr:DUF3141 domain-containing protein [Bordetella petrii]MDM9560417.1 DUF3141 domain-containing protein [Bordetella petrii]